MKCNKTVINCGLTGCKYNSACCNKSQGECYCTLSRIDFVMDEEMGIIDCKQYEYDYTKPYMCVSCQLEQEGEIDITPEPEFIEVDNIDDLF